MKIVQSCVTFRADSKSGSISGLRGHWRPLEAIYPLQLIPNIFSSISKLKNRFTPDVYVRICALVRFVNQSFRDSLLSRTLNSVTVKVQNIR